MKKIITLVIALIFIITNLTAQVWKHPYQAGGIVYPSNYKQPYNFPVKLLVIDSSSNGVWTRYKEYDANGNIIADAFQNSDTTFKTYNPEGYCTQIIRGAHTSNSVIHKNNKGQVDYILTTSKQRKSLKEYIYDSSGNIIEFYIDSAIIDRCKYDSLNRIIEVKNYRHSNGNLSNILSYSYFKDTIYYTDCSYNTKGERYNLPCDEVKGVYNEQNNLSIVLSVLHDSSGPVFDTLKSKFNEHGFVTENINALSNGSYEKSLYFYNYNNILTRIERHNREGLTRVIKFEILK